MDGPREPLLQSRTCSQALALPFGSLGTWERILPLVQPGTLTVRGLPSFLISRLLDPSVGKPNALARSVSFLCPFFLGSSTILRGVSGPVVGSVGKPGQSVEAITIRLEWSGFLGCGMYVLTPEKSCAKAEQAGPPTSFQPSQHLIGVQSGKSQHRHRREDLWDQWKELLQGGPGVGA